MLNQKELDDMTKILSENNELTYCVECMHYKPSDSESGRCLIADEERESDDFCSRGDKINGIEFEGEEEAGRIEMKRMIEQSACEIGLIESEEYE